MCDSAAKMRPSGHLHWQGPGEVEPAEALAEAGRGREGQPGVGLEAVHAVGPAEQHGLDGRAAGRVLVGRRGAAAGVEAAEEVLAHQSGCACNERCRHAGAPHVPCTFNKPTFSSVLS